MGSRDLHIVFVVAEVVLWELIEDCRDSMRLASRMLESNKKDIKALFYDYS